MSIFFMFTLHEIKDELIIIDNKAYFFMINFAGAMVGAFLIFIMIKWLKRVVLEHTGSH